MAVWTFTLYGSDTKPAVEAIAGFPLKTALDALVGTAAVSQTIYPYGLYPTPETTAEVSTYLGGYKTANKDTKLKFELRDAIKDFPGSNTSMDDFYYLPILTKRYNYIHIPNGYYLLPEEIVNLTTPSDYVMEVIVTGYTVEHQDGTKKIIIELEKAYNE